MINAVMVFSQKKAADANAQRLDDGVTHEAELYAMALTSTLQTRCDRHLPQFFFADVIEQLHDLLHAADVARDLARQIALALRDAPHQIHHAALGHDLDRVRMHLFRIDEGSLDLARDQRIIGARGEARWQIDGQLVDHRLHVFDRGDLALDADFMAASLTSPVSSTLRLKLLTLTWPSSPTTPEARDSPLPTMALSSVCAPSVRRSVAAIVPTTAPPSMTPAQPCKLIITAPHSTAAASGLCMRCRRCNTRRIFPLPS